jgi:hypothetical protein
VVIWSKNGLRVGGAEGVWVGCELGLQGSTGRPACCARLIIAPEGTNLISCHERDGA